MGDRVSLQHSTAALRNGLELEEQARLADTRLADRRDDLTMATAGEFEGIPHLLQFGLPADELRQSAPRRHLQTRAQRPEPNDLEKRS
jgi:hypothetical protein